MSDEYDQLVFKASLAIGIVVILIAVVLGAL